MDYLFTPWRYSYVSADRPEAACVLCEIGGTGAGRDEVREDMRRAGL